MDETLKNKLGRPRLNDRQIDELIGIARGVLADGALADAEIEYLHKWLVGNLHITANAFVAQLFERINEVLADGVVDDEERADLFSTLMAISAPDFELGEALKPSTLPYDNPTPQITFSGRSFCFTGTFVFGARKDCKQAVIKRGGIDGTLKMTTSYLVIGEYATDSWKHSTFGNKIEKAVKYREKGCPIAIISEQDWTQALEQFPIT